MSDVIKIGVNLGDGLSITNNKIGVNCVEDELIHTNGDGLFVDNLNGKDGTGSSQCDGYSMKSGIGWDMTDQSQISDFIDMDRSVVNLIFTFGMYKPSMRHPTTISYSTSPKDVQSMCNEIVVPLQYNATSYTSYRPNVGEMIQLVTNPLFRTVPWNGSTIAVESMNRYGGSPSQEVKAMFVITEINYMSDIQPGGNLYWVHDMKVQCIYSTISDFVVGTVYSGIQGFDSDHI